MQRESLAEKIAGHIGEMIIRGKLKAGERIQEQRIAASLNVSRGSLREAFLLLERRYLIDLPPRRGAVVSSITSKKVNEIYEIYELLLARLIRKATRAWIDDDLHLFLGHVESLKRYAREADLAAFYELTFRFERDAYRFADNEFLINMLEDLQPALRRHYYFALEIDQSEIKESLVFFQQLMTNIVEHNEEGAVAALATFAQHQKQLILAVLENNQKTAPASRRKSLSKTQQRDAVS